MRSKNSFGHGSCSRERIDVLHTPNNTRTPKKYDIMQDKSDTHTQKKLLFDVLTFCIFTTNFIYSHCHGNFIIWNMYCYLLDHLGCDIERTLEKKTKLDGKKYIKIKVKRTGRWWRKTEWTMEQTTKNKSFTQIACVLCLFAIGICICPGFRIGRRRTYPSPECSHSRISPKQTMLFGCALMQISHYTRAFCFVLHRWCWLMLWRGKNEYGFFPPINSGFALAPLDQIKRYLKRWTVMKKKIEQDECPAQWITMKQ